MRAMTMRSPAAAFWSAALAFRHPHTTAAERQRSHQVLVLLALRRGAIGDQARAVLRRHERSLAEGAPERCA
jgi:hypothetical protein